MKLTWHIVKKDLCRFMGPMALLGAVFLLRIGIGASLLTSGDPDRVWFGRMAVYANVLWGVALVVTYLLAAAVIQEDSLASPAFWQTRPMSGARLLGAKAIGLFLMLGVLPVILHVPWWLGCGFGWMEILRAAIETLGIQLGAVLLALPLAVVTGHYGRFLLWTLVAAVAWITIAFLFASHAVSPRHEVSNWVVATRLVTVGMLAAAGCAAVAIHQFVTRRTWRSIAIITATGLTMIASGRWLSWDGRQLWTPRQEAPTGPAAEVRATFDHAYAYLGFSRPESNTEAQLGLRLESVPPGYIPSRLFSEQSLRWSDGTVTRQAQFYMWGPGAPGIANVSSELLQIAPEERDRGWMWFARRHNLIRLPERGPKLKGEFFEAFSMTLTPDAMKRLGHEKPDYDGIYWFRLQKPELTGEGDLRAGSVIGKGSGSSRVVAIDVDDPRQVLWIGLVERSPNFLWSDFRVSMGLSPWPGQPEYAVVDKGRTHVRGGMNETEDYALVADVSIVLRKDGFRARQRWSASAKSWENLPEGIVGATLAKVEYREVEQFSLTARVENLTFNTGIAYSKDRAENGRFTITGEANRPGTFKVFHGENIVTALRDAGGVTDRGDLSAVTLTRTAPDGTASRIVFNLESWLDGNTSTKTIPEVGPGDVIDVPAGKETQSP